MAFTPFSHDMEIIAKLSDTPNVDDGLTAYQLKEKFDEGGKAVKNYINNVLLQEAVEKPSGDGLMKAVNGKLVPAEAGSVGASEIADGAVTSAKIANGAVTNAKIADAAIGTSKIIAGSVTRAKLATDTFYNPVKAVAGVTSYDLTAEDVGPMIRTGWNEAITFNITQAVSSALPVGVTFELLAYGNKGNLITLHMPDVQVGVPSEPAFYSSGADLVVADMLNSVALKKVNSGTTTNSDVWLVIGNVEVV